MTREQEFRRRWHEAHRDRFIADEQQYQQGKARADRFPASAPEALGLLAGLRRTGDLESFKKRTQEWAVKPTTLGFKGTIGQMMLNIFVNRADEPDRIARLLVDSLSVPASDHEARAKIGALADYSRSIKRGAAPALTNVPFVSSYFWGLADHDRWPVIWPSARHYVEFLTGAKLPADPAERYQTFVNRVSEMSADNIEFEMTASWWRRTNPVLLDEVLCDRAEFGLDRTTASESELRANAQALTRIAEHIGYWFRQKVSDALGDDLKVSKPKIQRPDGSFRNDLWVDFRTRRGVDLGVRVWGNHRGVAVGLSPGFQPEGWHEEVTPIIEAADYPGCEVLGGKGSDIVRDVGFHGKGYVYGRWFERGLIAELGHTETVVEIATLLKPLYEELLSSGLGTEGVFGPDESADPSARERESEVDDDRDFLGELADELLIDRSFLDDIESLLKDKRQVILYGPPGTGKTYLARKFAEALIPDADRRAIVQFHPSSSYEDFFEGYRPEEGADGSLTYRRKPGPLARMADKARSKPDRRHIMIIDEINRANLPKVLGELLYLFEYRDEPVQTLYRPDEGFVLPRNLWFIGTMNTADRSIALVDAALRRRFHFVPFFPNRWPIEDLLERWLEDKGEPTWVAELVAQVNDELKDELGGSHLLLGPSYFMQENLDEEAVRRIWEYNIEPFIEDQFFDISEQIDMFRFNEVLKRYREESGVEETTELVAVEHETDELDSPSETPTSE
ncbi:MAG: AAA family ATPase [Acidimicrobiaceae bacterium]|nr:AAA family ATPase [Acidimicrobiaceae bacterium]